MPYSHLQKNVDHVEALRSLCRVDVDWHRITRFMCMMHEFKDLGDINEACFN